MEATLLQRNWIITGALGGILTSLIYPFIYYIDFPIKINLIIGMFFALSTGMVSYGIFQFAKLHKDCICLQIGMVTGIMAALIFALKTSVEMALQTPLEGVLVQGDQSFVYALNGRIQFGIWFLWDVLIAFSIFAFSVAFTRQPKPGKVIFIIGFFFALIILSFSIYAFPEVPEKINLTGMGPFLPVWHLIVSIFMLISLKWVKIKNY